MQLPTGCCGGGWRQWLRLEYRPKRRRFDDGAEEVVVWAAGVGAVFYVLFDMLKWLGLGADLSS